MQVDSAVSTVEAAPDAGPRKWPLTAYSLYPGHAFVPEPAGKRRAWIDATPHQFARRCLPLTVANQAGWVVRLPFGVRASWNGEQQPGSMQIEVQEEAHPARNCVNDHFGAGVLTFSIPYLFRTPPGIGLLVRGAPNFWVDGAHPLEGLVETDWATATFTMNWRLTAPHRWVEFRAGDPICFLQPMAVDVVEAAEPVMVDLADHPEVQAAYSAWSVARDTFNADSGRTGKEWQKDYFLGKSAQGQPAPKHRTRVAVAPFDGAPSFTMTAAPAPVRGPLYKAVAFTVVAVDGGYEVTDPHGVAHRLSPSATYVLQSCTGTFEVREIAEQIAAAFRLPHVPHDEVAQCVSTLVAAGLITAEHPG